MKLGGIGALLLGIACGLAAGQPGAAPTSEEVEDASGEEAVRQALSGGEDWTVRFEPSVWYAGLGGNLRFGGGQRLETEDLNLDEPEARAFAEVHLQRGRWRMMLSGYSGSADGRTMADAAGTFGGVMFSSGDVLRTSMDIAGVEVQGAYRLFGREEEIRFAGNRVASRLEVVGGARFTSVDVSFRASSGGMESGRSGEEHFFGEPYAGLKWSLDVADRFTVDLQATGGALPLEDGGSASFEVLAGGVWRPVPNVGVQAGYRFLMHSFEDGDGAEAFEMETYSAGLYGGVVIRF